MRVLIAAVCIAASAVSARADALVHAEQALKERLRDPDSAKFETLERRKAKDTKGTLTEVVCGRVNAKNRYGGYAGRTRFVFFPDDRKTMIADHFDIIEGDRSMDTNYGTATVSLFCDGTPSSR